MDGEYRLSAGTARSLKVASRPDVRAPYAEGAWKDAPPLTGFEHAGYMCETPPLRTELRVVHHGAIMTIAFKCTDPEVKAPPPPVGGTVGRKHGGAFDHLIFLIDPKHDHAHYVRISIDLAGHVQFYRGHALKMEQPSPRMSDGDSPDETADERQGGALCSHVRVEQGVGWEGAIEIPAAALGLEGSLEGRVMGFNCRRIRCKPPGEDYVWWRPVSATRSGGAGVTPLDYGDVYFTASRWRVSVLDFGYFVWDRGTLRIELTASGPAKPRRPDSAVDSTGACVFQAETRCVMPVDGTTPFRFTAEAAAGGKRAEIEVAYDLDIRGKWLVAYSYTQRLEVEVREKTSATAVYAGSFPVAFCAGLIPNEPHGLHSGAPDPSPSDAGFIRKKRDHVTGRLPRFFRRTTAEGAASDFTLESAASSGQRAAGRSAFGAQAGRGPGPAASSGQCRGPGPADGSVRFDLMEAGVMERIARYIESLFDNETNRLAAAMYFIHQRTVTRHASALGRIYPASPLSLIRGGGGICGVRAPVLAGLVSRMNNPRTGRPYHTRILELGGHTVTAVADSRDDPDEDCFVLDADVGLMFFAAGSSRLATLGELRRHPETVRRSTAHDFRHDHHMFSDSEFQFTHGWPESGSYPEGAPEW